MAKSIRGTFTRPSTSSFWAMNVFYNNVVENVAIFTSTGEIETYMKGDPENDLVLVVDHVFRHDDFFEDYKTEAYKHIPSWKTAATATEVDEYMLANNQTLVLEEVDNPDLTGYIRIELVPNIPIVSP